MNGDGKNEKKTERARMQAESVYYIDKMNGANTWWHNI